MRDLTKDELNVTITALDVANARETDEAKKATINRVLELLEMELVLLKPIRRPAIRKEPK